MYTLRLRTGYNTKWVIHVLIMVSDSGQSDELSMQDGDDGSVSLQH